MPKSRLAVYTDGSCRGNPGPGGWACVYQMPGSTPQFRSGWSLGTTNNEMELQAIFEAIANAPDVKLLDVYSDSAYSIHAVTDWFDKWSKNGFKTASGNPVQNKALIQRVRALVDGWKAAGRRIVFHHVRGHSGDHFNELADRYAREAMQQAVSSAA